MTSHLRYTFQGILENKKAVLICLWSLFCKQPGYLEKFTASVTSFSLWLVFRALFEAVNLHCSRLIKTTSNTCSHWSADIRLSHIRLATLAYRFLPIWLLPIKTKAYHWKSASEDLSKLHLPTHFSTAAYSMCLYIENVLSTSFG